MLIIFQIYYLYESFSDLNPKNIFSHTIPQIISSNSCIYKRFIYITRNLEVYFKQLLIYWGNMLLISFDLTCYLQKSVANKNHKISCESHLLSARDKIFNFTTSCTYEFQFLRNNRRFQITCLKKDC